jgi:hypothetical protein
VTLTDEKLAQWKRDAEKHPSGQRCDGIHDATPDYRNLVLIAEVERLRSILSKYLNVVGRNEGVDFLDPSDFTAEEWVVLCDLPANNPPHRMPPLRDVRLP